MTLGEMIKRYREEHSMSMDAFSKQTFDAYVEVGTQIKCDFCLRAKGDSMIDARIHDGDVVFIKKQPEVENGEIAAVIIDDETTLKRFYAYSNKIVLQIADREMA